MSTPAVAITAADTAEPVVRTRPAARLTCRGAITPPSRSRPGAVRPPVGRAQGGCAAPAPPLGARWASTPPRLLRGRSWTRAGPARRRRPGRPAGSPGRGSPPHVRSPLRLDGVAFHDGEQPLEGHPAPAAQRLHRPGDERGAGAVLASADAVVVRRVNAQELGFCRVGFQAEP